VIAFIKQVLKRTPALDVWIWYRKNFSPARSQSDESDILGRLIARYPVPQIFVEFGFGTWEFNCAGLTTTFDGLLLDGDSANVAYAMRVLPKRIQCEHVWLTLETLEVVDRFAEGRDVGILSVDVDGNDYWFLRRLITLKPAIVVCEFNPVFGLRPISVPYDDAFERFQKHSSGLYFGTSLSALDYLCGQHGYTLMAVSRNGVNAFFVRDDLLVPGDTEFDMSYLRHDASRRGADPFDVIAALEFVDVTQHEQ
jgi:hypothetical protein